MFAAPGTFLDHGTCPECLQEAYEIIPAAQVYFCVPCDLPLVAVDPPRTPRLPPAARLVPMPAKDSPQVWESIVAQPGAIPDRELHDGGL